jgi:transforming growth factor-beta-induced protein
MKSRIIPILVLATLVSACDTTPRQSPAEQARSPERAPVNTTDVIAKLEADGNFKSLLAALATTGLAEKLRGEGPFTLFAPTDDAFAAAREGLQYRGARIPQTGPRYVHPLPTERDLLLQALQNHLINGKLPAADLAGRREDKTVNGMTVSFDIEGDVSKLRARPSDAMRRPEDMFMVNLGPAGRFSSKEYTANLTRTDIEASNGVVHVIDAVLLHPVEGQQSQQPKKP